MFLTWNSYLCYNGLIRVQKNPDWDILLFSWGFPYVSQGFSFKWRDFCALLGDWNLNNFVEGFFMSVKFTCGLIYEFIIPAFYKNILSICLWFIANNTLIARKGIFLHSNIKWSFLSIDFPQRSYCSMLIYTPEHKNNFIGYQYHIK